jgi:hypothetical protein
MLWSVLASYILNRALESFSQEVRDDGGVLSVEQPSRALLTDTVLIYNRFNVGEENMTGRG